MLRFDHMPSDYNPLFLFLGNRDELIELADLLRRFSEDPRPIDVRVLLPEAGGRSALTIVPGNGPDALYGLRPTSEPGAFTWTLNGWQAGQVAAKIDALTTVERKSGNDIIELGIEGEIPVKISRGEFTEDFLTPRHYLDPEYVGPPQSD